MRFELYTWAAAIWPILFFSADVGEERSVAVVDSEVVVGIVVDDTYTVEELITDVFAEGTCENISNVQAIGNESGIGYFENGEDIFGIDRGVILATGFIANASGPNGATDKSGNFHDDSGDVDLNIIAEESIKDAVGIEFDFVPLDSFVHFKYVFASEEYCEFVGSAYNDVFGFFISGPGITGGFSGNSKNVALIPGTNDFVTINSVNRTHNPDYYIGNETSDGAFQCGIPYYYTKQDLIEYDGFTTELTASLKLDPCGTYHIRLVVADVKDNYYDSAVFLEAGSFNLGGKVEVSAVGNLQDGNQTLTEGCDDAYFLFEREVDSPTDYPLTIGYYFSDQSVATLGLDYEPVPLSITIPSGVFSKELHISALNDNDIEPAELLRLVLDVPCACYADSAELFIIDPIPMQVDLSDIYVCENSSSLHSPNVEGGNPPYTYLWSNNQITEAVEIFASGASQYVVTVFDACGHEQSDTCQVLITTAPSAILSGEERVCTGDTAFFQIVFEGVPPWDLRYAIDGVEQVPIVGIWESVFDLPVTENGNYQILQLNDQACVGIATGTATLEVMEIFANIQTNDVSCFEGADGTIEVQLDGANPPFDISWSENFGNATFVENLSANRYFLFASDAEGCEKAFEIEINEPSILQDVEVDCESLQQNELNLEASGGTPPYLYSIDAESFMGASLFLTLTEGGVYDLTVQDANACLLEQAFVMPVLYQNMFDLPSFFEAKFNEEYQIPLQLNIPESLVANVLWSPTADLSCSDCLNPILTALSVNTYTVEITDIFGCTSSASISIGIDPKVDVFVPTVFSPNGDEINDYFLPLFNDKQVKEILLFQVFDRWGGMLYESKNFQPNTERKGWNGMARNKPLDNGIYVFLAKLKLIDNSETVISGDVLLLR